MVKSDHFALFKLIKVLLSLCWNCSLVNNLITIGRSEPRVVSVVQSAYGRIDKLAKDMSGHEGSAFTGILVGALSLSSP